ncbi:MAG: iron ABC transporter permease [Clostridiales Family XIII bacterium]|nr:iron ABC transporter permease [Clostridiales Family XIII bacterium]
MLSLGLVFVCAVSFLLGRYFAPPASVAEEISRLALGDAAGDPKLATALFNIRFPRIVVVTLVGMALSVAGASYQGMFKNPLVSPDLLGASAGASFGACLALLLNLGNEFIQIFAFVAGLAAVGLVMLLNRVVRGDALLGLILGGILVGTLFTSGTSIIKLVADADDKLPAITFWLMGSFAGVTLNDVLPLFVPMAIGFVLVLTQRWNLNAMSFGEDEARALGVNTKAVRALVILGATLLTASSIAVAGVIGWIGLVVPHLTRALVGPNYRILLPTTMLTGAIFLLIVDNFARLLYSVEIPIGLLTSILGVPFFIFIYRKNLRGWS